MIMRDFTYADAIHEAEHLIALGEDVVHLRGDDVQWDKIESVEVGGGYRFSGPINAYLIAHEAGLTLKWGIDFEGRDANGRGVSLFDRPRLRDVMTRLPLGARQSFANLLADKVLPELAKRTAEIRDALNQQWDSEDCVRGLIALGQ